LGNNLTIESIDAGYGAVTVLTNVSLRAGDGETVALLGTNGNGKTTLMRCITGQIVPKLTVEENLILGAYRKIARARIDENIEFCFEAFPRLKERRGQMAGSMSGGEQQMLALGRALMASPRILLVDEPSVGLAPILVARMIDKIAELSSALGLTVLMAEQNFEQATRIANRGYVLVHGQVVLAADSVADLRSNDVVRRLYLGAE
jgi:branched-chain amino acid transport system ATP-binding protein